MKSTKKPSTLHKGDLVLLIAPAKYIATEYIEQAKSFWLSQGYQVELGQFAQSQWHRFAGEDHQRLADLQWALNHPTAKAIHCLRGGYGLSRIIDQLNWQKFKNKPKWIIGYSDITLLHQQLNRLGFAGLHASMPFDGDEVQSLASSLDSLIHYLENGHASYDIPWQGLNRVGQATGKLVGGNLTLLSMSLATPLQPDFSNSILFIEEIGEYDYGLDRYLNQLKHHGVWQNISGLIIGYLTGIKSSPDGMGCTLRELFLQQIGDRHIPVMFGFPAGHELPNLAFPLNTQVTLSVAQDKNQLVC